jgi:hypothetical protein
MFGGGGWGVGCIAGTRQMTNSGARGLMVFGHRKFEIYAQKSTLILKGLKSQFICVINYTVNYIVNCPVTLDIVTSHVVYNCCITCPVCGYFIPN